DIGIDKQLLLKEIKTLSRDTGFAYQSYLGAVLTPVMVFIYYNFMGTTIAETGEGLNAGLTALSMSMFFVLMFACGLNYTAHAAFTREGKYFYILKYLPVPYETVYKIKMRFALIVSFVGIGLSSAAYIVAALMASENVFVVIINAALICGNAFIVAKALIKFGMIRDLKRPNLVWNNMKEALKNNTYVAVPMFIAAGAGFLLMVIGMILAGISAFINDYLVYGIFWAAAYIIAGIVYFVFAREPATDIATLFERVEP
ncbi:MAG: hypothetical protein LBQ27_02640, partial [Clostridiales bacterium]|nr:hypothetical protein [Clostridiales bacterium]